MRAAQPEVQFSVPLTPPSVNHYLGRRRGGGAFITPEAKAFKEAVALYARGQRVAGPSYGVEAAFFYPTHVHPDLDNLGKLLLDSLQSCGVIGNDKNVVCWIARREPGPTETRISVWSIGNEESPKNGSEETGKARRKTAQ